MKIPTFFKKPWAIFILGGVTALAALIIVGIIFVGLMMWSGSTHRFVYFPVPDNFLVGSEAKGLEKRQFVPIDFCFLRSCEALLWMDRIVAFKYPDDNGLRLARIISSDGKGWYIADILEKDSLTVKRDNIYIKWIIARD